MHRSGTGMVADALNDAGICMGVFREHNGEALHFLSLNQQMMLSHHSDWLNPKPIDGFKVKLTPQELFAEHIKCRYHTPWRLRLLNSQKWGWKDPRNTFTLGSWMQIFPKAKVLHVLRDGRAVAASLMQRNQITSEVNDPRLNSASFCFGLWEKYEEQAFSFREIPCFFTVKYEDIVEGNEKTLRKLREFCEVDVKFFPKQNKTKLFSNELNELAIRSEIFKKTGYSITI